LFSLDEMSIKFVYEFNRFVMEGNVKKKNDVLIHSTKAGKLYILPSELFAREKFRRMLQRLIDSSIPKKIGRHSV
jgi:hypothetical protein